MLIKGKKDIFYLEVNFTEIDNYYNIEAFSNDGKRMGHINFRVDYDKAWIYSIKTKDEYQHMGVGQALIDACEYICATKKITQIQGKYYPSNDHAKPFYEKNGYSITREYYETFIIKYINCRKTLERLADKIINDEFIVS